MTNATENDNGTTTGRVWLITGATSGFGRAIAEAALAAGDTVVAAARRPQALDDLAGRYPGRVNATGYAVDLNLGFAPGSRVDSTSQANRLYQTRTDAYRWLVRNAGRYGFVNYVYEPWHWEWVGEPADAATAAQPAVFTGQ